MLDRELEERVGFFRAAILRWARENLRDFPWRKVSDPYRVLVTEKLLQQTDFGHVRKVWEEFFKKFPTVEDLARASEDEIAATLRPLGLWRQRARQLKKLAETVLLKYGGEVPCDYEKLIYLPGVGDYAARATLTFACNKPTYILDTNTRKVITRFFYYPKNVEDRTIIAILKLATPEGPEECKVFNWGIIDFSALICSRKPKCDKCPLKEECAYHIHSAKS